jgi:glutaredoxin 3
MKIVIYSKDKCPNCVTAKKLMTENGLQYEERDIEMSQHAFEFFATFPNVRQMPQILVDGILIGGLAGLKTYLPVIVEKSKGAAA